METNLIIFAISTNGYDKLKRQKCCEISYYANLQYPFKRLSRRMKKRIKKLIGENKC